MMNDVGNIPDIRVIGAHRPASLLEVSMVQISRGCKEYAVGQVGSVKSTAGLSRNILALGSENHHAIFRRVPWQQTVRVLRPPVLYRRQRTIKRRFALRRYRRVMT
jgi:hypothetical protein